VDRTRTSAFDASLVEGFANVVVGRKSVEDGSVGDGDVAVAKRLSDGATDVGVEQIVGADDHHAAPVVLQEYLHHDRVCATYRVAQKVSHCQVSSLNRIKYRH